MNFEHIISLVANLGALSVAVILYAAYIKSLRSQISLKDEQLKTAEQNIKLWKDKTFNLERQSPQYVEKVLADRIRIREEEIARLAKDDESHQTEIEQKNAEIIKLKAELETAQQFGRGISIYDSENDEYRQLSSSEIELKDLGEVWVDSATLLITDPWHIERPREIEIEDYPPINYMFRSKETGEIIYMDSDKELFTLDELKGDFTARQLVEMGCLEELPTLKELPADPESYIKGGKLSFVGFEPKTVSFYNGLPGAGLAIGTSGDGTYTIRGEVYKGKVYRIFIDL